MRRHMVTIVLWNVENQAIVLIHDLLFPFSPVGLGVIIGLGAIVVMLLGRRDDVITTGITTAVIMVSAGLGPASLAWTIPPLRLLDTVIGDRRRGWLLVDWKGSVRIP